MDEDEDEIMLYHPLRIAIEAIAYRAWQPRKEDLPQDIQDDIEDLVRKIEANDI
jgi:hypothetical protein